MVSCLYFVFCFCHSELPSNVDGGGEEKSSFCLYISGFSQTVVTQHFSGIKTDSFFFFFGNKHLLFSLSKIFCCCFKDAKNCMRLLLCLQYVFNLSSKKPVLLLLYVYSAMTEQIIILWMHTYFSEVKCCSFEIRFQNKIINEYIHTK